MIDLCLTLQDSSRMAERNIASAMSKSARLFAWIRQSG